MNIFQQLLNLLGKNNTSKTKKNNLASMINIQDLDQTITCSTDTATLALFDPDGLENRVNQACDWWINFDNVMLPEMKNGLITLLNVMNDGYYKIRLTGNENITDIEKDYCVQVVQRCGVHTDSGFLFIGDASCLPGEGQRGVSLDDSSFGEQSIHIQPGAYDLTLYGLNLGDISNHPNPETKVLADSLADIIVCIKPRDDNNSSRKGSLRLDLGSDKYLFKSTSRTKRNQPIIGNFLKARVIKVLDGTGQLKLREIDYWPKNYRVTLSDWSKVKWNDYILIEINSIDKKNKEIVASVKEYISRSE